MFRAHSTRGWPPRITYTERSKQHVELRGSKTIKVPNRSFGFCTAAEKYLSSSIFFFFGALKLDRVSTNLFAEIVTNCAELEIVFNKKKLRTMINLY